MAQSASPGISHRPSDDRKVLIVVLSRTGNTMAVASLIQEQMGGKLVPLSLMTPYPKDYHAQVEQVVRENENGFLPPLATKIDSISSYDLVFVGFPTWDMKLPPPIKSFLKSYDLHGKTVIPFNTNAGYGVGSSFDVFKELCAGCKLLEGFTTKGGVERDGVFLAIKNARGQEVSKQVETWLKRIELKQ